MKVHVYPMKGDPRDADEDSVLAYSHIMTDVDSMYDAARRYFRENPGEEFVGLISPTVSGVETIMDIWRFHGVGYDPVSVMDRYKEE